MSQLPEQIPASSSAPMPIMAESPLNLMPQLPPQGIGIQQPQLMTQSNSMVQPFANPQISTQLLASQQADKRRRRSKHELEGRIFLCHCGKSYLSQPALNNHKKTKHPELMQGDVKRGRGRPRKYPPSAPGDFESTKYEPFFTKIDIRKPKEGETIDTDKVVNEVFDFLYKGESSERLFSHPKSSDEVPVLKKMREQKGELPKPKEDANKETKAVKTCDDVFYEYLATFKEKTNQAYFVLLTKFVLLFRECYDISKNKDKEEKVAVTNMLSPEGLPDLCNEFYGEFMEPNEFFGIKEGEEKNEIIEIIQHFCIWLFKNEYTKSKLSLAA